MIPYGKQDINQADINAVVNVLQSDFLTQGPQVPLFENELTKMTGANYVFAVNSATSALHIACLALGLKQGDWLWTSPITFVASANCGLYCQAKIDFIDIDPYTYNLCPKKLKQKLLIAKDHGCLPKIVIPVHFGGQSCDMQAIYKLSQEFGFSIIEDASHAIGGRYLNQAIGSCVYSDISVFSFHPVKILTTAEGGAVLTNNANLAEKLQLYRGHGITKKKDQMIGEVDGDWYYQQIVLGYNYRMTDLQAALGISQLQRLSQFVETRQQLVARYHQYLVNLPITLPVSIENTISSWHLYVIRLQLDKIKLIHKDVFDALRCRGIGVNIHYIPVHLQPYYQKMGFKFGDFPEAEKYYQEAISLPLFYGMTHKEQDQVITALQEILLPSVN